MTSDTAHAATDDASLANATPMLPLEPRGDGAEEYPPIPGSTIRELEQYAIQKTLASVGGSTSKAAKILGISVRKIQYRMNAYRKQ